MRDRPSDTAHRNDCSTVRVGVGAVFDDTKTYRYVLWRNFVVEPKSTCLWIMLNPSTADEFKDDPTVRRCQQFSRQWGFDACRVVNIFAYRSTNPKILSNLANPVGPENDLHLQRETKTATKIVCAWGAHGSVNDRSLSVRQLLIACECWCFGLTKNNEPRHPLYQHSKTALVRW